MKLVCQVVGSSGDCVVVPVDETGRVAELKDFVKQELKLEFSAAKLKLYMAKKKQSSEWLEEEEIDQLTQEDVSSETLEVYLQEDLFMKPIRMLNYYFGNDLKSVLVHVLVQLPSSSELVRIPVAEQWWQRRLHALAVNIDQYTRHKTREAKALYQRIWKWVVMKACKCWQRVANGVCWLLEYFNKHVVSLHKGSPQYAECSSV